MARAAACAAGKASIEDDAVDVSVKLESFSKVRCVFEQQVKREDEVLVKAKVAVACVSAEGLKPVEIPEPLKRKLEASI